MALPWPLSLLTRAPAPAALPAPDDRFDEDGLPLDPVERARADVWRDWNAGHGTDRDPRLGIEYVSDQVTDEEAVELLRGSGLAAKIATKIVSEALRPGFEVEIKERSQLRTAAGDVGGTDERPADKVRAEVEAEWRRLRVFPALRRALIWERARGGAAIMLGLEDMATKPEVPARPNAKLAWLRVVASRDLQPDRWYDDPHADKFGEVELWRLNATSKNGAPTAAQSMLVHESRLILFPGARITDEQLTGQHPGFGDSIFVQLKAAIRRFEKSLDGVELLLRNHGEPYWKVKNLSALLAQDKGGGFKARVLAMQLARSQLKMRVIDAEDDSGVTPAPLAGIREILEIEERELAALADTPATILFGDTPAGIGDGNAGPRKDWEATATAWALDHVQEPLERLTALIMAGRGGEPVDWKVCRREPSQLSEKDQAEIRQLDAATDVALCGATIITPSDARKRHEIQARYQIDDGATVDPGVMPLDIRDPGADLAADPNAAPIDTTGKSTEVQATALNGAQVASMVGVITAVVTGQIPREAGAALLAFAFQVKEPGTVNAMLGPPGWKPEPAAAPPVNPGDKPPEAP